MKKLLTVLFTLLMVITLVGCGSKEQTPVVEEPQQQEVVEPKVDEPIVGGFVDAEDKTITDELKDIFNKALDGLTGTKYEPVELVATQVVAGTNYKFLANGTKTTNPITKGTYYIYVNKDLQGNVSLLDIETIEEKQEETPKQDVTQMSFWVVFYDQYGNELQREALKYGTIPEYKTWLPEGFDKWVYKKSQKDVGTLKAITGNTYYQAVCHEVYHSSSEPTPGPIPTPVVSVTSVSLNETALTLSVGNTGTLAATVLPENATNKNVTWSSNNESVATVSNGTVSAIAAGTALITVTTEDGSMTNTCTVTVSDLATITMKNGITTDDWNTITIKIKGTDIVSGSYCFGKSTDVNPESWTLIAEQILSINSTEGLKIVKEDLDGNTEYKIVLVVSNSAGFSQEIEEEYNPGQAPPP